MSDFNILNNQYVSTGLTLFLVLYAGLAAPQLPERVAELFENETFKLFIMFMIAYMSSKDITVALLVAIGFAISLQTLTKQKISNKLINLLESVSVDNDDFEKHKIIKEKEEKEEEKNTKYVTFNENKNQYYKGPKPDKSFFDLNSYEDDDNIPKYTGGTANDINELSNNSPFQKDETNGLGWESYYDGSAEYAAF